VGSDSVLGVLCCRANPVGGFGYRSDSSSPSAETIRLVATFCVQINKNELNKVARDFLLVYPQKYLIARPFLVVAIDKLQYVL